MGTTDGIEARIVGPDDDSDRDTRRNDATGIAFAAVAAVAFGTLAISAKFAYRADAAILPLLTFRFVGATVLVGAFHLLTRRSLAVGRRNIWKLLGIGGIAYGLETILFFEALRRAPASVVTLIFYSYPLWTVVIGFITKLERFRWRLVVALVVGSAGVAVVFSPEGGDLSGRLVALGAAVAVAAYFLFMQVALRDTDPAPAAFWTSAGAAIAVAVATAIGGDTLPSDAIAPAVSLAIASAAAFMLLFVAIEKIGSARSAIAAMIEPVATIVLAAVLLDEAITLRVVIGAALVLSALPLLSVTKRKPLAD